jgi:hypothetical protein
MAMPDDVAMRTAARELGLRPKLLELAVQVGEVRTVRGAGAGTRRVTRAEMARLRASEGFPDGFSERLRLVDAAGGAELLGISTARFARLARGGCFSPARFYVNRYRTVVWLYLARELHAFAERRGELLTGSLPRGLRVLLEEGVDFRPRHWRGRRVSQLRRQAEGPWELAAARAAVLDADALEEAVPDSGERARLAALKPELTVVHGASAVTREVADELCTATAEDEILWHRLLLEADLEDARASSLPSAARRQSAAHSRSTAQRRSTAHSRPTGLVPSTAQAPPAVPDPSVRDPLPAQAHSSPQISVPVPERPPGRVRSGAPPEASGAPGAGDGAAGAGDRRRAHVLSRLRGPRRRPGWWRRRGTDLSRPAF